MMTPPDNRHNHDNDDTHYDDLLALMTADRDALGEEPSPYFFARQKHAITHLIESQPKSLLERLFPQWATWRESLAKPALMFAIFTMLFCGWTVFRSGGLFFKTDLQTRAVEEMLLSNDTLILVFDMVFSEEKDSLGLLF